MVAVIAAMALVDDVRAQLWWSLGSLAVVLAAAFWRDAHAHAGARRIASAGRDGLRIPHSARVCSVPHTQSRWRSHMTVGTDQRALDELCVNTIRTLSMDAVQAANSGHPGTPMALAPIAYLLYTRVMRHSPSDPEWPGRDRFVLSCGHASMLLYSSLYLAGYDVTLDQIKRFRQLDSPCAGHPEYGHVPGVETTTGPLGQGISTAVGMALGERMLAARFNLGDHTPGRPLHVLHRLRRRHGGGHRLGGVVDRRPPRASAS